MVGILLVAHGDLARGVRSALSLITGEEGACPVLSLREGDTPEKFREALLGEVERLDEVPGSAGVLILADLFGGTPGNCVARVMNERGGSRLRCVTGLNLPMLLEAVVDHETLDLGGLESACVAAGRQGVSSLIERMSSEGKGVSHSV